jgi:hypothetical protein
MDFSGLANSTLKTVPGGELYDGVNLEKEEKLQRAAETTTGIIASTALHMARNGVQHGCQACAF